jgi:hypothetical protein
VTVGVVDGRLLTFIINCSAKATDLAEDGRYAFHAHQDPGVPHEFLVRGHAVEVTGPQRRGAVADRRRTVEAAGWSFDDEGYTLHELTIDHAVWGERSAADAWPRRLRPITLLEKGQPPELHRTLLGEAVRHVLEQLHHATTDSAARPESARAQAQWMQDDEPNASGRR